MTIPVPNLAFDELITFLASSPSADEIIAYRPPEKLQARMSALLEKNRQDSLSAEEQSELDEFLRMNRFMSRLQAKAKQNQEVSCEANSHYRLTQSDENVASKSIKK